MSRTDDDVVSVYYSCHCLGVGSAGTNWRQIPRKTHDGRRVRVQKYFSQIIRDARVWTLFTIDRVLLSYVRGGTTVGCCGKRARKHVNGAER